MRLLEYLKALERPPSEQPVLVMGDVGEAAIELLDVVLPAIDALGGIRRQCLQVGLSEEATDEIINAIVRKMVEAM